MADEVYDLMNCIDKHTGAQMEALIEENGAVHLMDEDTEVAVYNSLEDARKEYTIF